MKGIILKSEGHSENQIPLFGLCNPRGIKIIIITIITIITIIIIIVIIIIIININIIIIIFIIIIIIIIIITIITFKKSCSSLNPSKGCCVNARY